MNVDEILSLMGSGKMTVVNVLTIEFKRTYIGYVKMDNIIA